jgi:hypothetical protein
MESPGNSWPNNSPESQEGLFKQSEHGWDDPHSYRPRSATQVLQELADKYRTLEWIPCSTDSGAQIVGERLDEVCYILGLKSIFLFICYSHFYTGLKQSVD